jgi:protein-tyrosine phosphatase
LVIQQENIKSVLSVGSYGTIKSDIDERLIIKIDDNAHEKQRLIDALPTCLDFIETELGKGNVVLVHCNGGISRSASVMIAYLMKTDCMSYDEAFAFVKSKKPNIQPIKEFELALRDWSKDLLAL